MFKVKNKEAKATLQEQTGMKIFIVLFLGTILFTGIMVALTVMSMKQLGGTIAKYTGTYLARDINSQGFLIAMGINDLRELDPASNAFKNWVQTIELETLEVKTTDPVVKLEKPLQLVTIVIDDRVVYSNYAKSFPLTPWFKSLYTNQGSQWGEGSGDSYLSYWTSPHQYTLYSPNMQDIGYVRVCVDPEFFLIATIFLAFLGLIILLVFLFADRYFSKFLSVPIIAPLIALEQRIIELAEMDPQKSFDSRLEIGHSLKEIESMAAATNLLIEKLQFLSMHDSLTGTKNRSFYENEILRLEQEDPMSLGVIICDVDHLKLVNDSKGHKIGDMLLVNSARILEDSVRPEDMLARIGGDEFAIFIYNANPIDVKHICERIKENIKKHNEQRPEVPIGISVGSALGHTSRFKIEDLFRDADRRMYEEKRRPFGHGLIPNS